MIVLIRRVDNNIETVKDYRDIKDKGEIAHFVAELESIKKDLLEQWELI